MKLVFWFEVGVCMYVYACEKLAAWGVKWSLHVSRYSAEWMATAVDTLAYCVCLHYDQCITFNAKLLYPIDGSMVYAHTLERPSSEPYHTTHTHTSIPHTKKEKQKPSLM